MADEVHIEGETEVTLHVLRNSKVVDMFVAHFLSVEYVHMWNDMEEVSMFLPQAVCHCVRSCMI